MIVDILKYIGITILIIMSLPSTFYFFVFIGIFKRAKCVYHDKINLNNTPYEPYKDVLLKAIKSMKEKDYDEISINSFDNLKLKAYYYNNKSNKTAILVHGYRSTPFNNFAMLFATLQKRNYNVLIIFHRAHEISEGKFSTLGDKEQDDVLRWIDWTSNNTNCTDIMLYGMSMGSNVIGNISDKIETPKVKVLVLDCGYNSFYEQINYSFKRKHFIKMGCISCITLFAKKILKVDIVNNRNDLALAKCKIPVLFIHGKEDVEVPFSVSIHNYEICSAIKKCIIVDKASHTTSLLVGGESVENMIYEFVNNYIK